MKVYSAIYHEDVAVDFNEAYAWYEDHQKGLGEQFIAAVTDKIGHIHNSPELYSIKAKYGYHEAVVDTFPYLIVYRIYKKQREIFIASIHHQKRHPKRKYRK